LNRAGVAKKVAENGVIAMKADKTRNAPEIDEFLVELGNTGRGIPFYAIFPGAGGDPILMDGLISQQQVLDALEQAGPSN
jgi:suppressor for copper-sensitivity B